ncbi:MAG: hypothetical protein Q9M21_01625 [Mariprofundaceae bacterium]|nr:hypothetical protein [Mariprofundaceae bacterium]
MFKRIGKLCVLATFVIAIVVPAQASGTKHVNVAVFHKTVADYEFEAIVMGRFSDFIAEMEKGSQIIFLNHTSGIKRNDVITLNVDVLSEENSDGFEDNGVNCSFSFTDESTADNTAYAIGGLCTILMSDNGVHEKIKAIIPSADLPDTSQGVDVWVMIYEDEKTGTAFYANVTTD